MFIWNFLQALALVYHVTRTSQFVQIQSNQSFIFLSGLYLAQNCVHMMIDIFGQG